MKEQQIIDLKAIKTAVESNTPKNLLIKTINMYIDLIVDCKEYRFKIIRGNDKHNMIEHVKGVEIYHCEKTGKTIIYNQFRDQGMGKIVAICSPNDTIIKL